MSEGTAQEFELTHPLRVRDFDLAETNALDQDLPPPMDAATATLARLQLKMLEPKNQPGSAADASALNAKHCAKAAAMPHEQVPWEDFPVHSLVREGRGCPTFRRIVALGLYPPMPFAVHREVGWCGGVSSSWWREWCAITGGLAQGGEADPPRGVRPADLPAARPPIEDVAPLPPLLPTPVAPDTFVESLRPKGAADEKVPAWLSALSANVCLGDEFWACFVHSQRTSHVHSGELVDWVIQRAKDLKMFSGEAHAKSDLVWLLELTASSEDRPKALQALRAMANLTMKPSSVERISQTVRKCKVWRDFTKMADLQPVAPKKVQGGQERVRAMEKARAKVPFRYEPVETTPSVPPLRMPYEGCPERLTVGEFAVGVGCFMASALAAGMSGTWMSDLDAKALAIAALNCPSVRTKLGSMFEQDPNELPWAHVLVGGACCQPFSKMGRQRGWEDERAYSTLRMLHNTATMQPWFVVAENVEHILDIYDGKVWTLIKDCSGWLGTRHRRSESALPCATAL